MTINQIKFVDLSAQYLSIKNEIDSAIFSVLEKSAFIKGKPVTQYEKSFAQYCETKECVGVGNGTDALSLTLRAMNIGPGDEVITVSHTFIATVEAITNVGATPVFIDIRDETLLLNPEHLESLISEKTKAIIPVHLYGNPCEMDHILDIAHSNDIKVIEDAAQAHGARWKGKRIGSWGDAACFSFYPGKNLGAYGDGGAVVSNNEEFIEKVRMLADHGRKEKYLHEFPGFNSRLDSLQAAILQVKLQYLDEWNEKRRNHAKKYVSYLDTLPVKTLTIQSYAEPVWHIFPIQVKNRDNLKQILNNNNIEIGVHYPIPVHEQPAYSDFRNIPLPVTKNAANQIMSLPMYPELQLESINKICSIIKNNV